LDDQGELELNLARPLPFYTKVSHRYVRGRHLWISILEGRVLVLDDPESSAFERLLDGVPPASLLSVENNHPMCSVAFVERLLFKVANAGFLRGFAGDTLPGTIAPQDFARFHLTNRCQLTCIHCYADSGPYEPRADELPIERWHALIDEFVELGGKRLLFTGGEALVFKGCIDLMEHAKRRGLEVTLYSNGILIPRHVRKLRDCADLVQISIDGPSEESNDIIRGAGSFARAKLAVRLLLDAGIKTRVSMVAMESNWPAIRDGLVRFAETFKGLPVEFLINVGIYNHGRGANLTSHLSAASVYWKVEELLKQIGQGGNRDRIAQATSSCGYAQQIVISPDGSVHSCQLLDGQIANVASQSLAEIVTILNDTSLRYGVAQNAGCKECDIRFLCGGTCRVENQRQLGNRRLTTCTPDFKRTKLEALVQWFDRQPESLERSSVGLSA
jgi:radical SAM protein with 4Fe4S-binding SPASM domain